MKILLIPPNEVSSIWNDVAPIIDKALRGEEELIASDFLEPIKIADAFLWIIVDETEIESAVITAFIEYPRKKSCSIEAWATKSGYKFDEVYPLIEEIKNFARINGCDFMEAKVRKGLAKKLKWNDKHSSVTLTL